MSTFAFVNYARFVQRNGTPTVYAYQNFSIDQPRIYSSVTYQFAPFAVSSGAGSKGGDRSETTLAAGTDEITVNIFAEAVNSRWYLDLKTVALNPETFADTTLIRSETWRVARYEMDTEKVLLKLTSPLDAVRNQAPNRYLTTGLVGALPSSATLTLS